MAHPLASSPENPASAENPSSPENAVAHPNVPPTVSVPPPHGSAPPDPPPSFTTRRLHLRPWRDTDTPGPDEGPDGDSLRFMPPGAEPGPEDFPAWLARRRRDMDAGTDLHWCVADASADTMLGNVQIFRMGPAQDRFQGELGYWLRPGARGRGIIGEALRPVIAHAFRPVDSGGLGLVRLHAATNSDNFASQSILRSAGFTQWGADHQAWRSLDGSLSDGTYFELLASELHGSDLHGSDLHGSDLSEFDLPEAERLGSAKLTGRGVAPEPPPASNPRDAGVWAMEPVTIDGGPRPAGGVPGVRLRAWRHSDADRVAQACSDPTTQHWLAHSLPSPYALQDAHAFIAGRAAGAGNGKSLSWCVADADSDLCLGSVAIMDLHHAMGTSGEIGYWAHPDARGRGVMTEAVRLAVRHAFIPREDGGLGRQRLQLIAADGNTASQNIARANGFVEVGRDRQAEKLADRTFVDLVRFDLLVGEWNAGD